MTASARPAIKVCLAASAGGHLSQLLAFEPAWQGRERIVVTTGDVAASDLARRLDARVYVVGESNRLQPLRTVVVFLRCLRIALRERPDVVVSTGASVGCMLCILGKIMGARIVWIDSIANVDRVSMSGRVVHAFADLFIVQWPDLAGRYKRVEYHGQLL